MTEIWSEFIKKINYFTQALIKYFSILFKKTLSAGKLFSNSSIEKIEENRLKWEVNNSKKKLGHHIYKTNLADETYNFSNDTEFHKLVKKIKEIEDLLNTKK